MKCRKGASSTTDDERLPGGWYRSHRGDFCLYHGPIGRATSIKQRGRKDATGKNSKPIVRKGHGRIGSAAGLFGFVVKITELCLRSCFGAFLFHRMPLRSSNAHFFSLSLVFSYQRNCRQSPRISRASFDLRPTRPRNCRILCIQ